MSYPCVPMNNGFINETKLDLRAIYRRPNGDLASLPMRRHHQWTGKGMEYVTLADHESLAAARPFLMNAAQYVVGIDGDGRQTPWNLDLYMADRKVALEASDAEMAALVATHGVETVEAIKGVKVPERLKKKAAAKP